MRKVAVVTGTRAEFGLLRPLIEEIDKDESSKLQLIVTAMHLSPEFGYTIKEVEECGYKIDKKIECLLSSDSAVGVSKSVGVGILGFADAFEELNPDLLIVLGDRTEILAAVTTAMVANIPIAHISGGETTEGAYDESIRHAITKMSYLHFASTDVYRKRIIQLGENPDRVFNVGAIGLDSIKNVPLLDKEQFENSINFKLGKRNILITFHPVTLEEQTSLSQFKTILQFLATLQDTHLIFTYANSDKNGNVINQMIEEFVGNNKNTAVAFKSLGQKRYLSALHHVDIVFGNSSSGIVEAPYFNIPTINIGDRQKGRMFSESIIQAEPTIDSLKKAFEEAFDSDFQQSIQNQEQLFGSGDTSKKIKKIISESNVENLKKSFFDIKFEI